MQPSNSHSTQRGRILALLVAACGGWVPLTHILALGIAQYSARILELRREGHRIESRSEWRDGKRHTWFRLVINSASTETAQRPGSPQLTPQPAPTADNNDSVAEPDRLFPDDAPPRHLDLG